jgi:hypothetical protein
MSIHLTARRIRRIIAAAAIGVAAALSVGLSHPAPQVVTHSADQSSPGDTGLGNPWG